MTGVVFAVAVFTTIVNPTKTVESMVLWQMLLVSGLCALTSLIYPWNREMGKVEAIVKTVIQYVLVNVIVLGSGILFDWYDPSRFFSIAAMVLSIAIIFGAVLISSWKREALYAARMNELLEEYQKKDGAGNSEIS